MGFNRIMNTILKFRKVAEKNNIDQQISKDYPKYKRLLKLKDNFKFLSDEDNQFIEQFEALLDKASQEADTTDYNLHSDYRPITNYDRAIHHTHNPMDDIIHELIENPLFPYVLRSRVERNTFDDQNCKNEIEKVEKFLASHKSIYERYKDEIDKVQSIIDYNDRLTKNKNNAESELAQTKSRIKDISNEMQQLNEENTKLNNQLDTVPKGEEYTYRKLYHSLLDDNGAIIDLYKVGNNRDKYKSLLDSINKEIKNAEDELTDMTDTPAENTNDFNNIKNKMNRLISRSEELRLYICIAEAIIANDSKHCTKDQEDYDAYDYIEAIKANNELIKLTKGKKDLLPNVPNNNGKHINWRWEDIQQQAPIMLDIQERIDTVDSNQIKIEQLDRERNDLSQQLINLETKFNEANNALEDNDTYTSYSEAIKKSQSQDYKDHKQEVTEYISQQTYLKQLQRAYKLLAKGSKDNKKIPDEHARIQELQEDISATEDYITANHTAYEQAMNMNSGKRSYKDNILIQDYERAKRTLDNKRIKLQELQRTNTEKLQAVDITKIDYKKIANKIIQQLTSDNSLLSILLTQSINKFVPYYLMNNNYQAPNLSSKMRLLHYYMTDKPNDNVRLKDLKDFQDSDKNMDLLQSIALLLMKDSKDNIMAKFLSILKTDFKEIYKSYNLATVDGTNLFIVDQDTQGKNIRLGPYTLSKIKEQLGLDKNPDIGDVFTRILNNQQIKLQIIEDNLTGDQIYDLLKDDDQQEIKEIFDKVKLEIQEYIRSELQYKSFEICNNPGQNFYSVMLAQAVQNDIADNINYNTLEQWLTSTKAGKTKEWNTTYFNQNVKAFMNEIIKQLCASFNTENEYHMFIQFLQANNVQDNNMKQEKNETNIDYYDRLKKIYGKAFNIFKAELERIIKKRIALCKKELKIRDKDEYTRLSSQDKSSEQQNIYNLLNGYTNENGETIQGLNTLVNNSNHEIQNLETELCNSLIQKVKAKFNDINEELIKQTFNNTIIKLIRGKDNINKRIIIMQNEIDEAATDRDRSKNNMRQQIIHILQILQTAELSNKMKQYQQQYQDHLQLLKEQEQAQGYLITNTYEQKAQTSQNSFLVEFQQLYNKLYGREYNPLTKMLKLQKLMLKSSKEKLNKSETEKLNSLKEQEKTYMQYFNEERFISMLSKEKNYQNAGLYGKLISYNNDINLQQVKINNIQAEIEKREANEDVTALETEKQSYLKSQQEITNKRDKLKNEIQSIRQRIKALEDTYAGLANISNASLGIDDEQLDIIGDGGYNTSLYSSLLELQNKNTSQYKEADDAEVIERQQAYEKAIDSIINNNKPNTNSNDKQERARKIRKDNDESINDEQAAEQNEGNYDSQFMHFDSVDIDYNMDYDKKMKLYWENPEQLGDLVVDIDENEAKRWMDKYIKNHKSISNPAYRPSKETVDAYLQEQ